RSDARWGRCQDDIRCKRYDFHRVSAKAIGLTRRPSHVDIDVAADCPARLLQTLQKCGDAALPLRIVRGQVHEHADAPHTLARLLRTHRERPRRRAADERDELAALHSITSSARASSVGGTSMPSARAVCRLITNSNLVGCTTGKSPGLAPLRILPA